jgi:acyl carrier protein
VGRHDNFFDLGGHSLLATQIVSRVSGRFDLPVPLKALFEEPTLSAFADYVATLDWSRQGQPVSDDANEAEQIRI